MKPLHHPYFVKFIIYFNENQDFFECHEVLEDYWNSFPNRSKEHPITAYILLSTGLYHWRRGNNIGALRTLEKANEKMKKMIQEYPEFTQGINFIKMLHDLDESIKQIKAEQSFSSFSIEVTSTTIKTKKTAIKKSLELLPFGSDAVIHKHRLRDRSHIQRQPRKA